MTAEFLNLSLFAQAAAAVPVPASTADTINDFVLAFAGIVWEAMPFIVLGAIVAGILEEVLPQEAVGKLLPKSVVPAIVIGGLLGLVFPMCECGIVVVMRRLLRKGLPLSVCVAYMLAGPILNVIVLFSTYIAFMEYKVGTGENQVALGTPMVLLRGGLGFVVACVTAFVVHVVATRTTTPLLTASALPPKKADDPAAAPAAKKTLRQRLDNITSTALGDFLDIMAFLILGSLLAAFIKTNPAWTKAIQELSVNQPALAIPAMMGLAVLLCLCSEADAFLAAGFTGMSISARLSFLVLGPMLDLKLLLMYTRVFRPKLILTIVTCTFIQVLVYCFIVHLLYNPTAGASVAK